MRTGLFAEVLVDIPARDLGDKLFTYSVPDYLQAEAFIGSQVLVPFGNQDVTGGYVVSIKDSYSGDFTPKDIAEIVDTSPLFDRDYVDFLHFVAEYYATTLSAVIAAAVPAGFSPRLRRVVKAASVEAIDRGLASHDQGARSIIQSLRDSARMSLTLRALRQRCRLPQAQFYRSLSLLRQAGLVEVGTETQESVSAKVVSSVSWTGLPGRTPRQEAIIGALKRGGGQMPLSVLIEIAGTTYGTIKRMVEQGMLVIAGQEVVRDPMSGVAAPAAAPPRLTQAQESALARMQGELARLLAGGSPAGQPWLIHGVTGSGKTEVYLRLIERTLAAGRTALMLVPEISLTPQLAQRLKSRFGEAVAVWHSALSAGERYDTWRRVRAGGARVLLGARSAVLAAMPSLGLIVLDEEHDGSYKQSSPAPRYHARHLALERARREGAMVVLGSATPDVGSYWQAERAGRLIEMPERVFKQVMPAVTVVDMRAEFAAGNRSIFSRALTDRLTACLANSEQAILLMNRRGFANHVFCRACGHVVKCRGCSVAMVMHQPGAAGDHQYLCCHHCGRQAGMSQICPACQSPFLKHYGLGTQRVEQDIRELYPEARVLRLDSDVASRKGAYEEVFRLFSRGEADILVGTQMVAKGLDIANVTLVGALSADAAFNLPDYRSVERGFQLLTQVAGRAGRGDRPGHVVLQTYNPDLPALAWAKDHDYKRFAEAELASRQEFAYPPFGQLIRVVVAGPDELSAQRACEELAEELTRMLDDHVDAEAVRVLGPAPCLIERLRGKWRYHLIVKNLIGERGRSLVASFLRAKHQGQGLSITVDVDAFDML